MRNSFVFTRFAQKKFLRLENDVQKRVREKLGELKDHEVLGAALKPLINFDAATHRLRIGDYRLILQRTTDREYLVIDIGHRRDVYK